VAEGCDGVAANELYKPNVSSPASELKQWVALTDAFNQRVACLRIHGTASDLEASDMACIFERQTLERSASKVRPYPDFYFQ